MPVIEPLISYHQFEKRDDIDRLIRDHVAKLDKFCDHIERVSVVVEKPNANPSGGGSGFRVRIDITVPPQHEVVAKREPSDGNTGDDIRLVIRETFGIAERQLKKLVEKQRGDVKSHAR